MIHSQLSERYLGDLYTGQASKSASVQQQTIFACELGFVDGTHVTFNAGFLATVRYAYPESKLSFFGSRTHTEELKQEMGSALAASISWNEIHPQVPGVSYSTRFFRELPIIWRLLKASPDRLVFTSVYPSTLLALKLLSSLYHRRSKVQVILHGIPSGALGKRSRHPIRRFQDVKTALTIFPHTSIQYLVLERSIRETLVNNIPSLLGKIESFDHPMVPNVETSASNDLRITVRFGFLGVAIARKGFPVFLRLAAEMKAKHSDKMEFHVIGSLESDEMIGCDTAALDTKPSTTRIGRPQFLQLLKKLHFVILPHPKEFYELSAAGTLLDAIAWEKPIVARRIPIFLNLFEKYGDIGFLFDDEHSLSEVVDLILRRLDNAHYLQQVQNIRKVRSERSPVALAESYRQICIQDATRHVA